MRLEVTLWEESWNNNCCASSWKGGSGNTWPEKVGEGSFPSQGTWWQCLCQVWQQWHGDTADGSARPAQHGRAGVTQQGCSGLELLCSEVFSSYCNLCPGSGGKVEPSVRAVLGISKCLWVPVCDIHRQSAENICKLQEACELCPSQEHLLTVYCWLTLQIKFAWTAKRSVMGGNLTSEKLGSQHFGCLNYIWIKLLIKS